MWRRNNFRSSDHPTRKSPAAPAFLLALQDISAGVDQTRIMQIAKCQADVMGNILAEFTAGTLLDETAV